MATADDAPRGEPLRGGVARAVAVLRGGGVVCFPTESVYGLAVDPADPAALARLIALKGRDARAPIALIAADLAQAKTIAAGWPPAADELARAAWPGALTLVVPAAPHVAAELRGPAGVGVRVPDHALARALAAGLGRPITATSANRSGEPAAIDVGLARAALGDGVDLYLDGGTCAGTPSTVVAVGQDGTLALIREGAVALPALRRA
jgi:L-threonylcarbamoyladenylate synthase